jgi:hypothetical protein
MGFRMHCAVARVDDDAVAARILDLARSMPHLAAQRLDEPWRGVAIGFDPDALADRIAADPLAHGFADEDAAHEAAAEAIERAFDALFDAYPDLTFAFIEADCFGGTCLYSGRTVGPGTTTTARGSDAHQRLLAAIGVADPPWYFAPFTRGFFDTGREPDGPKRRPTLCYVSGTLTGMTIGAATIAATLLAPPWKLTIATSSSAVLQHGDDLVASINVSGPALDLRASSLVDAETTTTWIEELVEELSVTAELRLVDPDNRPLRSWRVG